MHRRVFFFFILPVILAFSGPEIGLAEPKIERSLSKTKHGFARISSPTRAGAVAHYFELRHGDCGRDRHWNDCKTDRERTEVWLPKDQWKPGTVQWIGYSIFVPSDFVPSDPVVTTAAQIHMQGGPTNTKGGFKSTPGVVSMNLDRYGYTGAIVKLTGPRNGVQDEYIHAHVGSLDSLKGRWTDIQIGLDTSIKGGAIEIWANGRLVKKVRGFHPHTAKRYYFKYGLYRSFVSRYSGQRPTQRIVFDEVRLGPTRESVVVNTSDPVN